MDGEFSLWLELVKDEIELEEVIDEWIESWGGSDEIEEVELVELFN